jgi:hypothetical protein
METTLGLIATLSLAALSVGCSAGNKSQFSDGGSGGNQQSSSSGTAGSGNDGAGGGLLFDGGTGDSKPETLGCSADLRYVVDGAGVVVEECWPDKGCSNGECVPPCQAAGDSKGNVGCDFTVATPHFYVGIKPPCFAVFLANNWPKDVKITIERGGVPYDVSQWGRIPQAGNTNAQSWPAVPASGLPPGQVAVLFLSQDPASFNATPLTCPIAPAVNQGGGSAVQGSGIGQAWRIKTDIPVSAYDILPYGGAKSYLPSAELLLPTTAWGDNYIAVLPKDSSGPPWGQLVANENGTKIDLLPSVSLPAAGPVPGGSPQVPMSFTLNSGEYVQWQLSQDMGGTIIKSDKPVAFTGGNAYICYQSATSNGGGCDSAHQQIPPIAALGSEYVAPPYADRGGIAESIPYRLVGAVDGTVLSYDPAVPAAPALLGLGQIVDFETVGSFTVSSQDADHPFYVGQIMTGCMTGNNSGLGDEEFVNILPPAQYLSKYVFFTDPTYPTTNLVVTRVNTGSGFKDVTIDCLGKIGGWKPVGGAGKYEVTNVDLIRLGVPVGTCSNGPHVGESEGRFGLMVWGLDNYSSYGYPAGGSVAPINTVVVPPVPN